MENTAQDSNPSDANAHQYKTCPKVILQVAKENIPIIK
jgi:hypothetical protein